MGLETSSLKSETPGKLFVAETCGSAVQEQHSWIGSSKCRSSDAGVCCVPEGIMAGARWAVS